jgi:glycosyltransferase involved in cell wall biosynthesis
VSEQPIRVAMIGQKGYPPVHGGIEKHVAELAARLAPSGIEITLYSRPHYSDTDGPTVLPGVTVRRLASIPTKHLDAMSHTLVSTWDAIRTGHDILHYHALGPGLLSGVPRCLGGHKTVVTVHGLDWQREKWGRFATGILRVGEYASARLPNRTIVVSHALADHFSEKHGVETVCIPNGISTPVLREPKLMGTLGVDKPYILFVGRLVPEKGCHLLTAAYAGLPREVRERFKLVIAGDAGFTERYASRLRDEAVAGTVFTGFVHGPVLDELYTNADLVVLPSSLEGLSIALLEGMSYGKCCLVSDIPPNVEAGADCAPFFPTGNLEALTGRMLELLGDPEACERFGQRARQRVLDAYSWTRAAEDTLAVYRSLVGE